MTARFTRLRIAGFKSFAEPVSIEILPGLTGIVGPNGCGKSNVVEALRWVMGESSARSMRGGEMDDVIFAGTTSRASRNIAEVVLTLEDTAGLAPPPFAEAAELQVMRRIERGEGSLYRLNGRELRARDVQTLFADLASGARSSAMVSQGRVASLIGARPEERRQVLEEAAGITGLHARRHEAELKLRASEANLERAEELRGQLDLQLEGLKRQARQAARYRSLSGLVREAEAAWFTLLRARAELALDAARTEAVRARRLLNEAVDAAENAEQAAGAAAAALPALREHEADARSALERRRVETEGVARAEAAASAALAAADRLAGELAEDLHHATAASADALAHQEQLAATQATLEASLAALPEQLRVAEAAREAAQIKAREAAAAAEQAGVAVARAEAASAQAGASLERAILRAGEASHHLAALRAAEARAREAVVDEARLAAALAEAAAAGAAVQAARHAAAVARQDYLGALASLTAARAQAMDAEAIIARADLACDEADQRVARAAQQQSGLAADWQAALTARIDPAILQAAEAETAAAASELEAVGTALVQSEAERIAAEAEAAAARRAAEDAEATRRRVTAEAASAAAALHRLEAERNAAGQQHAAALSAQIAQSTLAQAAAARTQRRDGVAKSAAALAEALERHRLGELRHATARRDVAEADAEAAALRRETVTLAGLMEEERHGHAMLALDAMQVPAGLESALAAGLGTALESAVDRAVEHPAGGLAGRHWRILDPLGAAATLPGEAVALGTLIAAPAALSRALSMIGLIGDAVDGAALQPALSAGQILVRRDGAAWRWDGHVLPAGEAGVEAEKLRQRNRLAALHKAGATAEAALAEAGTARELAAAAEAAAADAVSAAALVEREALAALADAETAAGRLAMTAEENAQRLAAAAAALARTDAACDEAAAAARDLDMALAGLPDAALPSDRLAVAEATGRAAAAREATLRGDRRAAEQVLAERRGSAALLAGRAAEAESRLAGLAPQRQFVADEVAGAAASLQAAETLRNTAPALGPMRAGREAAEAAESAAHAQEAAASLALQAAETRVETADAAAATLSRAAIEAETRLAALLPQLSRTIAEAADAQATLEAAQRAVDELAELPPLRQSLEARRSEAGAAADAAAAARVHHEQRAGQGAQDQARRLTVDADLAGWAERAAAAAARREGLAARHRAAVVARDALIDAPDAATRRHALSTALLEAAQSAHLSAAEQLRAAERAAQDGEAARRIADAALSAAREALLRAEAAEAQAAAALAAVLERIGDRLTGEATHDALAAELPGEEAVARAQKRFERLAREREEMGPVNLLAEREAAALETRSATTLREGEELASAIASLRGSIGHLNREGRERLSAMFTQVDREFQTLFGRMFSGGRAHLSLVGSDDVLAAGLEIYVQPPGKKLATLSLLSGGEQALTALSLIFAIFRCNPAPICVLDEVDAPLDDANVDRFCTLLEEMVGQTGTRFLVVTHHQLTMARMDRLYGVTMQERGVSRLLSVDLVRASALVEARQAAE